MTHYYQTKQAGGFLQAAGSGPMGFAIPAALAAKLVNPERPVVAVCGDGGFAMTMNGLMSAIEQDIPIIVVVFNNNALGWVHHGGGRSPRNSRISIMPRSPARWGARASGSPNPRRWRRRCARRLRAGADGDRRAHIDGGVVRAILRRRWRRRLRRGGGRGGVGRCVRGGVLKGGLVGSRRRRHPRCFAPTLDQAQGRLSPASRERCTGMVRPLRRRGLGGSEWTRRPGRRTGQGSRQCPYRCPSGAHPGEPPGHPSR